MNRCIPARDVKALRSGQTIWGVWGNTPSDLYVFPVRVVGTKCYNAKHDFPFWRCKRHADLNRWWMHDDKGLSGTFNDRWFTTRRKAERFLKEIQDGLHPDLMYWWSDRCLQFDLLDEGMGIDRGLGTISRQEDDFQEDEHYMELDSPRHHDMYA